MEIHTSLWIAQPDIINIPDSGRLYAWSTSDWIYFRKAGFFSIWSKQRCSMPYLIYSTFYNSPCIHTLLEHITLSECDILWENCNCYALLIFLRRLLQIVFVFSWRQYWLIRISEIPDNSSMYFCTMFYSVIRSRIRNALFLIVLI